MEIEWEKLIGMNGKFYGAYDNCFKIGSVVFQAVEDKEDGYRSCMDKVAVLENDDHNFVGVSFANVVIRSANRKCLDGFELVDMENGHVYLEVGTDNSDNYYPCFIFEYNPRNEKDLLVEEDKYKNLQEKMKE